uniref:T9SS type A sorting domain-containing protein n=1 Tax=Psychroserpens mesophilus TaxID=325473 RepID=UPI00059014E6
PPTEQEIEALFTDNCGNVNATLEIVSPAENTDCLWAVLYRYTIVDDCGNYAAPVKIYHNGGDKTAPELVGDLPEGVTGLQCLSENPGAPDLGAIQAAYTDNCGDVVVTPFEPNIVGDDCGWTATYEYEIKDTCGNKLPNLVIVNSGEDTMAPELDGEIPMGENTVNACKDSDLGEPTEEEIAALFSDNCTDITADNVLKVEKLAIGSDCEWIRVFEYTVSDNCGNLYPTFKINYQGGDSEAPMATGECADEVMVIGTENGAVCPADASISLNIGDEISAGDNSWSVAGITVAQMNGTLVPCFTDNCADVDELTFRVIGKSTAQGDCSTTLTVTFEVEDLCENVSEPFLCTFIVVDDTAPVVECPEGEDFGLVTETPTEFADKATWTDNCQGSGETEAYSDDLQEDQGEVVYVGGDYVFTFEAGYVLTLEGQPAGTQNDEPYYTGAITNLNGAILTEYGTFEVIYNPSSGQYDVWQDFGNGNGPFVAGTASADAFEICDANAWYFEAQDGHNKAFTLQCPEYTSTTIFTLVRTFTADDGCGNVGTCDVTYTWSISNQCNEEPIITCPNQTGILFDPWGFLGEPQETFDSSPDNAGYAVATNGCGNIISAISYTDELGESLLFDNPFGGEPLEVNQIIRTWTATNAAGLSSSCIQIISGSPIYFNINRESGLDHQEEKIDFKAFPVPFDNEVTITYEFDYRTDVTIEFFDTKGLLVLTETNTRYVAGSTGRTTLDLSRTSNQVFYVKLTTNQGSVTKKIVSSGKK